MAIFPANRPELVQALIDRLSDDVDPDKPIVVEASREVKGELKFSYKKKMWDIFSDQSARSLYLTENLPTTFRPVSLTARRPPFMLRGGKGSEGI